MAQKRMFSKKITTTDAFLDMPLSAQCLYFHLNMEADDDGFIGNVKTIRRMIGAGEDDLKLLMVKEFVIPFESGVVVIKDWKIHNYIQKDRYNETIYLDEKQSLIENENKQYEVCTQNVSRLDTQVRVGKDRLDKSRLDKSSSREEGSKTPLPAAGLNENPFSFYENNGFGTLSPYLRESIVMTLNDFIAQGSTDEQANSIVIEALKEAIQYNVRNWKYTEKILINWLNQGHTTVEEVLISKKKKNHSQKSNEGESYGGIEY